MGSRTARVVVQPAYSAQPSVSRPNPRLEVAIDYLVEQLYDSQDIRELRVADQGCGKLRHLSTLENVFHRIWLIDTEFQLSRRQTLFGTSATSVRDYVARATHGNTLVLLTEKEFEASALNLDIIFCLCVMDVVLPNTRSAIIRAAHRNLRKGGLYVVIIPRNDQSILVRCRPGNRYSDGHVFSHPGNVWTFYRNFQSLDSLLEGLEHRGFVLQADLSIYRQVCLIMRK